MLFANHALQQVGTGTGLVIVNAERELAPSLGVEDDPAHGPSVHHHRVPTSAHRRIGSVIGVSTLRSDAIELWRHGVSMVRPTLACPEAIWRRGQSHF